MSRRHFASTPAAHARAANGSAHTRYCGDRIREHTIRAITNPPVSGAGRTATQRCATVYVPNHRPVPIMAWYADRQPKAFQSSVPKASATVSK